MKKKLLTVSIAFLLCNSFVNSAEFKEKAEAEFPKIIKVDPNSANSGYDFIGLKESDPITMESFADMINEKHKADMPFVISRVLSLDNDGNKIYKYYPLESINEHVYGPKFTGGLEFARRENGHVYATGNLIESQNLSRFKITPGLDRIGTQNITDPIAKSIITGEIRYYAAHGTSETKNLSFEYIGSDKELTDPTPNVMQDFYKRIRLARFLHMYMMEKLTDQDKADLLFLLGRIYQFSVNNSSAAAEYFNLALDFMKNHEIKNILDCVGHTPQQCATLDTDRVANTMTSIIERASTISNIPKKAKAEKPVTQKLPKFPKEIRALTASVGDHEMGFDYLNLNSTILGTSKTFGQELDEKYKQGLPFVIARIVSLSPDETVVYSYYPVSVIHKSIYGTPCFTGSKIFERTSNDHIVPKPGAIREDQLSRYSVIVGSNNRIGAKSVYDPKTKGYVALPINYYVGYGSSSFPNLTFNYIGSDKDLTESQATDFESFPKKIRLARFFYLYCQADQKNILKEDIADLLFLLSQIYQLNVKNTPEAQVYYNLTVDYMKKHSIKNIIDSTFTQREGNVIDSYSVVTLEGINKLLNEFKQESIKQALFGYQRGDFPNVLGYPNQSRNNRTALIAAAIDGNFPAIEALISIGGDLTRENQHGQTPIMLYKKDRKLIDLLILNPMSLTDVKLKEIVSAKDDTGKTVLQYAKENFPNDKQVVVELTFLGAKERDIKTSSEEESWGSEENTGDWGTTTTEVWE